MECVLCGGAQLRPARRPGGVLEGGVTRLGSDFRSDRSRSEADVRVAETCGFSAMGVKKLCLEKSSCSSMILGVVMSEGSYCVGLF